MKKILRLSLLALGLLIPFAAAADYSSINGAVNAVSGALPLFQGSGICSGNAACGFVNIIDGAVIIVRPVLTVIAVLVIVIFGYRMIIGQEDDALTKSRAIMSSTIAGLIMVYLIDPFIHAFYGASGEVPRGAIDQGVAVVNTQVSGIINWVMTIVAVLGIFMIILSALKAIGQSGGEEGVSNMRKTIFSVLGGILLLVLRFALSQGFVETTTNPIPLLASILSVVSYVMGFLGLIGTVIVVYAGFSYVLSLGNEERATKSKGLLIRAAIGVVVILVSLALVNFVILPFVG